MALASKQCSVLRSVNLARKPPALVVPAALRRSRLSCRASMQPAETGSTRRQTLGLLLSLPLLLTGDVARAVQLDDFRKAKGARRSSSGYLLRIFASGQKFSWLQLYY